jgi:hypothetical protein
MKLIGSWRAGLGTLLKRRPTEGVAMRQRFATIACHLAILTGIGLSASRIVEAQVNCCPGVGICQLPCGSPYNTWNACSSIAGCTPVCCHAEEKTCASGYCKVRYPINPNTCSPPCS